MLLNFFFIYLKKIIQNIEQYRYTINFLIFSFYKNYKIDDIEFLIFYFHT